MPYKFIRGFGYIFHPTGFDVSAPFEHFLALGGFDLEVFAH
jgi:hypothetical protein